MSLEPLLSHLDPDDDELPPIERWNPDYCGEMDLTITAEGRWIHEGTPIGRASLVRVLSRVMRREEDGHYYLVTPVEKVRLQVEDRPFLIVDADETTAGWQLTTNVGDRLTLGEAHHLCLSDTPAGEEVPEVAVRFGLGARLNRNVFYRLVELAEERQGEAGIELGLVSAGIWQPLGRLDRT
ncbi:MULTISPECIES: DUF1285 domain-containing protein [Halomonadaceae]|uniref:DUF1285 domain-containing protein n=1 Tax=Halomonadaceae TaxID=28256 RepID=UPI00159945E4|nr:MULTISPECIES: DUF1285 domain-containing protein [Halomonas]QJQ96360.1 DUF1285 domain-containing protein [Halomonas sp. PA5]